MKRRIALITEHAPDFTGCGELSAGDVTSDLSEIAIYLAANGWKVDVFTNVGTTGVFSVSNFSPDIRLIEVNGSSSKQLTHFKSANNRSFCLRLHGFIVDHKLTYQLIHANLFESAGIAVELKKMLKIPVVVSLAEFDVIRCAAADVSRLSHSVWKTGINILKKADALFVNCPDLRDKLVEHYKPNLQKTFFVPNGFNPDKLLPISKTMARLHLNLPVDEKVILYVGDLNLGNGNTIIKSMALLAQLNQPITLLLVHMSKTADDFANDSLLHVAASLGLKRQITIVDKPRTSSMNYYYAASDLFVATSSSAINGDLALKSMALGTPVLTLQGNKNLVVDGRTGFLMSAELPQLLADRISLLINNDRLLKQMSREAFAHVYSSYSWEKIAASVLVIYEHVLSAPRRKEEVVGLYSTRSKNKELPPGKVFGKSRNRAKSII